MPTTDSRSSRLEAGVKVGDFRIEERIGAGGMGIVYRARQISQNRVVALKILGNALTTSSDIIRFQREAQAASRLNHPNIASVYFVGQDEDMCYMAIEYVDGPSLRRIIRCLATTTNPVLTIDSALTSIEQLEPQAPVIRFDQAAETLAIAPEINRTTHDPFAMTEEALHAAQKELHVTRCCELARDVAKALAHAHENGVVHRDIKPDNILLDKTGQVRIIDFGVARFFEDATMTQTGRLVGTPMYMSPEQVTARLQVDHRSDIFSLGLVLYEMLTLQPAMVAETREGVLRNIVTRALPPVRSKNNAISQNLESVVHRATDRDPEGRYQSSNELADDLQRCPDGNPVAAKPYRYHMDLTEIGATRPRMVLIVSIIAIALGLFCVTGAFLGVLWYVSYGATDAFGAGIIFFGCSLATLLSGWGLFYARSWARWFAIASACALGILFSFTAIAEIAEYADEPGLYVVLILHVLILSICITTVCVLLRRSTKQWFAKAKLIRAEYRRTKGEPGKQRH